jgi:hypothetical protein
MAKLWFQTPRYFESAPLTQVVFISLASWGQNAPKRWKEGIFLSFFKKDYFL